MMSAVRECSVRPLTVLRPGLWRLIGVRVPRSAVPSAGTGEPPLRLVPAGTAALQLLTRYLGSVLGGPPPVRHHPVRCPRAFAWLITATRHG
jgi:hypothetical protein